MEFNLRLVHFARIFGDLLKCVEFRAETRVNLCRVLPYYLPCFTLSARDLLLSKLANPKFVNIG